MWCFSQDQRANELNLTVMRISQGEFRANHWSTDYTAHATPYTRKFAPFVPRFLNNRKENPRKHRILGISRGMFEADDGNRTRLPSLGSWYSTDELHLHQHVMNYNALLLKLQDLSQSICQSIGSIPWLSRNSFVLLKGLLPKNPRNADSGLG